MITTLPLLRAFRHPLVIASILVLLLNDHLLKATLPSPLTGKLSDFAGLFFFPFLLGVLIQAASHVVGAALGRFAPRPLPARRTLLFSFYLCAILFAAIKLLPGFNAFAADGLARLLGLPVRIALDPTDLIALAVFYPAWWLWRRIEANQPTQPPGKTAYLALALGSLAALATSPCPPAPAWVRLTVDSNRLYASQPTWGSDASHRILLSSADGGLTWSPEDNPPAGIREKLAPPAQLPLTVCDPANPRLCYRVDGAPRVEESLDGGQTWRVAWQVPPERQSFMRRLAQPQMLMACGKVPDFQTFDLAFISGTGGSSLVVAMGNEGMLVRRPDGVWQRVTTQSADPRWENWRGLQAKPTPFRAASLGDFLLSTQAEMWPLLGAALLVYLLLTLAAWVSAALRAAAPPTQGSWTWVILLLGLFILLVGLIFGPFLLPMEDGTVIMIWLGLLILLAPLSVIFSLFVWNRAGILAGRPGGWALRGWLAFGLSLLWFALAYGIFGLWTFGVIPTYESARVVCVLVGLLALAGFLYLLARRLKPI